MWHLLKKKNFPHIQCVEEWEVWLENVEERKPPKANGRTFDKQTWKSVSYASLLLSHWLSHMWNNFSYYACGRASVTVSFVFYIWEAGGKSVWLSGFPGLHRGNRTPGPTCRAPLPPPTWAAGQIWGASLHLPPKESTANRGPPLCSEGVVEWGDEEVHSVCGITGLGLTSWYLLFQLHCVQLRFSLPAFLHMEPHITFLTVRILSSWFIYLFVYCLSKLNVCLNLTFGS